MKKDWLKILIYTKDEKDFIDNLAKDNTIKTEIIFGISRFGDISILSFHGNTERINRISINFTIYCANSLKRCIQIDKEGYI